MVTNLTSEKDKILSILNYLQLSVVDFSNILNIKKDSIYSITNEKTKNITSDILRAIVKTFPEINPYWLITGEGNMLNTNINNSVVLNQHDNNRNSINNHSDITRVLELQQETIRKQSEQIDKLIKHITESNKNSSD